MHLFAALAVSLAFAALGTAFQALTFAGAGWAVLVGTSILWNTGWAGGAALAAFFASSSLISRIAPDPSARLGAKGSRRDHWQVLANGGPASIGALVEQLLPGAGIWLVTASLAAAAADTWATALGGWSRRPPRLLVSGRVVPPGTSGGVTVLGTVGGLGGSLGVALASLLAGAPRRLAPAAVLIGLAGMLVDSLLGSTLQGAFHCPACDQPTEQAVHHCGTVARQARGWGWLDNDGVNACATGLAALLGWLAWRWLAPGGPGD